MTTLTTKIEGVEYKCILADNGAAWIRVVRVKADGSKEDAFLSNRQWKKEETVKRRFAKEIAAHSERNR